MPPEPSFEWTLIVWLNSAEAVNVQHMETFTGKVSEVHDRVRDILVEGITEEVGVNHWVVISPMGIHHVEIKRSEL